MKRRMEFNAQCETIDDSCGSDQEMPQLTILSGLYKVFERKQRQIVNDHMKLSPVIAQITNTIHEDHTYVKNKDLKVSEENPSDFSAEENTNSSSSEGSEVIVPLDILRQTALDACYHARVENCIQQDGRNSNNMELEDIVKNAVDNIWHINNNREVSLEICKQHENKTPCNMKEAESDTDESTQDLANEDMHQFQMLEKAENTICKIHQQSQICEQANIDEFVKGDCIATDRLYKAQQNTNGSTSLTTHFNVVMDHCKQSSINHEEPSSCTNKLQIISKASPSNGSTVAGDVNQDRCKDEHRMMIQHNDDDNNSCIQEDGPYVSTKTLECNQMNIQRSESAGRNSTGIPLVDNTENENQYSEAHRRQTHSVHDEEHAKFIQHHESDMKKLQQAELELGKIDPCLAYESEETRSSSGKLLKQIVNVLSRIHKSHKEDLALIIDKLEKRKKTTLGAALFREYGKLLKQRQKKLLAVYRKHKQLLDLLNSNGEKKCTSFQIIGKNENNEQSPDCLLVSGNRDVIEDSKHPAAKENLSISDITRQPHVDASSLDKDISGTSKEIQKSGSFAVTKIDCDDTLPFHQEKSSSTHSATAMKVLVVGNTPRSLKIYEVFQNTVRGKSENSMAVNEQSFVNPATSKTARDDRDKMNTAQNQSITQNVIMTTAQNTPHHGNTEGLIPCDVAKASNKHGSSSALETNPETLKTVRSNNFKPNSENELRLSTTREGFCVTSSSCPVDIQIADVNSFGISHITSMNNVALPVSVIPSETSIKPANGRKKNHREMKTFFPTLKELIDNGNIEPGKNVLSYHTPERTYFATLLPSGVIQGTGGERFKTLLHWCGSLTQDMSTRSLKRPTLYKKVMYKGVPLSQFTILLPEIVPEQSQAGKEKTKFTASLDKATEEFHKEHHPQPLLNTFKSVNLISDSELIYYPDMTVQNFWSCQRIHDLVFPEEMLKSVDVW